MNPVVYTILVNWNGKADTLECIASLLSGDYRENRILVVDNGSADDSAATIKHWYPNVSMIETGENLGFTGGNNCGIRWALDQKADYVFLLNNDTTVETNALSALVRTAQERPDAGMVTPLIRYYDEPKLPWFAGSRLDLRRGEASHDNASPPQPNDPPRSVPWASGCAMLIPAELVERLGGFDDRYFLNWEDVDLSIRLRASGREIVMAPGAKIYHKVSRSLSKHSRVPHYYYARNNLLLLKMHAGRYKARATLHVIASLLRNDLRAIKNRMPGANSLLRITLTAFRHHFSGRYGRYDGL